MSIDLTLEKIGDILKLRDFAEAIATLLLHHGQVLLVNHRCSPRQQLVDLRSRSMLKRKDRFLTLSYTRAHVVFSSGVYSTLGMG